MQNSEKSNQSLQLCTPAQLSKISPKQDPSRTDEGSPRKHHQSPNSSVPYCREDCSGVWSRLNHLCCVFARIISVNPLEIEDKSGRILLGVSPTKHCKIGDYCYVLIDTCSLPPRCTRLTVVPESLKTVAEYQLQLARNRANERSNQRVCADDQFDNAFSADQKQEMDIDERDDAARFTTPTTTVKMETN